MYRTVKQVERRTYQLELCVCCLKEGHRFSNCKNFKSAYYCKSNHNTAFCQPYASQSKIDNSLKLPAPKKVENGIQATSLEVESITGEKADKMVLTVVTVKFSNPTNEEVE